MSKIIAKVRNIKSKGCIVDHKHVREYLFKEHYSLAGLFPIKARLGILLSTEGDEKPYLEDNSNDNPYFLSENAGQTLAEIDKKLKDGQGLSNEEEDFLGKLAVIVKLLGQDLKQLEEQEQRKANAGRTTLTAALCHAVFTSSIPVAFRKDVLDLIFLYLCSQLDYLEERRAGELTRIECFELYRDLIFTKLRAALFNAGSSLNEARKQVEENGKNPKEVHYILGKDTIPFEQAQDFLKVIALLVSDNAVWASTLFEIRTRLLQAEKLKLGEFTLEEGNEEESNEMSNTDIETAEETGKEHWQVKVDSQSSFGSMSKEVRSLLYRIPMRKSMKGFLNYYPTEDVMKIHKALMNVRSKGLCTNSDNFLATLESRYPEVYTTIIEAIKKDPTLKAAIFKVYNKGVQEYGFYTYRGGNAYYTSTQSTTRYHFNEYQGRYYFLPANADDEQRLNIIFDSEGRIKAGTFNNLLTYINNVLRNRVNGSSTPEWSNNNLPQESRNMGVGTEGRLAFIKRISDSLGLGLGTVDKEHLLTNEEAFTNFYFASTSIINSIANKKVAIEQIFSDEWKEFIKLFRAAKPINTRFYTRNEKPKQLSMDIELGFRYNKSTYFPHVVKNYLMDLLEDIERGVLNRENWGKLEFIRENPVIDSNYLAQGAVNGDPNVVSIFATTLTRLLGNKDTAFDHFSERDNLKLLLADNLEYYNSSARSEKFIRVPLFVTGDSNANRVFTLPMLEWESRDGKAGIKDQFMTVLFSELKRMEQFNAFINDMKKRAALQNKMTVEDSVSYKNINKNKDKFTFLTFLNDITGGSTEGQKIIEKLYPIDTENQKQRLKDKTLPEILYEFYQGPSATNLRENAGLKELMVGPTGLITLAIRKDYNKFIAKLKKVGLIDKNNPTKSKELGKLSSTNQDHKHAYGVDFLESLYLNLKFHLILLEQFLTIDPGFYDNTENFQKRFKEMIASGDPIDVTALLPTAPNAALKYAFEDKNNPGHIVENPTLNVVYVRQQKVSIKGILGESPVFRKLYDVFGDGGETKASLTDGQAWRSLDSYRQIMAGLGKWKTEHEQVYKIISDHRERHKAEYDQGIMVPLSEDDMRKILATGVIFQPLKPYYFGFEMLKYEGKDGKPYQMAVPVQHKYSEFPLIPELLPAKNSNTEDAPINKLVAMGLAMMKTNIDMICDSTCVKVGCFAEAVIDDALTVQDFVNAFTPEEEKETIVGGVKTTTKVPSDKLIHCLPLENWREQSNQPAHNDVLRARGTQVVQHAYANIAGLKNAHYPEIERLFPLDANDRRIIKLTEDVSIDITDGFNQETLTELLNLLLGSGFCKSVVPLIESFSTPLKIGEQLSKIALLDERTSLDRILGYDVTEDGDMLVPANDPVNAKDNCAALLAQLRKKVIKQGIKGGSAIQVSPYGFDDVLGVRVVGDNIVESECAMVFDITVKGPNGEPVELDYMDYVDHTTGMLKDKDGKAVEPAEPVRDKDGNLVKGKEFYGWNTKLVQEFGDILTLIAYRIPTEKQYSILNLKIKRFFPKTAGGIIMVPSIFTQVAGFDFDIDKLFFFRKSFGFNINASNAEVWENIYKVLEHGEANRRLLKKMRDFKNMADDLEIADSVKEATREIERSLEGLRSQLRNLPPVDKAVGQTIDEHHENIEEITKEIEITDDEGHTTTKTVIVGYKFKGSTQTIQLNREFRLKWRETRAKNIQILINKLEAERREIIKLVKKDYVGERVHSYYSLARTALLEDPKTPATVKAELRKLPETDTEYYKKFVYQHLDQYGEKTNELDPNKPLYEQKQSVLNDLFITLFSARLASPETIEERTTPGGPWMHKKAKPLMMAIRYGLDNLSLEELKELEKTLETLTPEQLAAGEVPRAVSIYKKFKDWAMRNFKDFSPLYDPTDPLTVVHYQTFNAIYDRLIGIAANLNIDLRCTALCHLYALDVNKQKNPAVAIKFGSMLDLSDSGIGTDIKTTILGHRDTELIVTEFLSAAVDAVKDALLEFFGIDDSNFNVVCFLAKIGASAEDLGFLFNQPVVQRAVEMVNNDPTLSFNNALQLAMEEIAQMGEVRISSLEDGYAEKKITYDQEALTTDRLVRNIIEQKEVNATTTSRAAFTPDFVKSQFAVVKMMETATGYATHISDKINITKTTSVKTVGSTAGSIMNLLARVKAMYKQIQMGKVPFVIDTSLTSEPSNVIIDPFLSIETKKDAEKVVNESLKSAFGMAQMAYAAIKGFWDNVICRVFPYSSVGFLDLRNSLNILTTSDYLSAEAYDDILSDAMMFLAENLSDLFEGKTKIKVLNDKGEEVELPCSSRDFYLNYFPLYFQSVKTKYEATEARRIPLLLVLKYEKPRGNQNPVLKFEGIGNTTKTQKDNLADSWMMMLQSDKPIIRDMVKHLIMYSYYQAGFDFGPHTVLSTMSTEIKTLYDGQNPTDEESKGLFTYAEFCNAVSAIQEITGDATTFLGLKKDGELVGQVSLKKWQKLFLRHHARKYWQFRSYIPKGVSEQLVGNNTDTPEQITVSFKNLDKDSKLYNSKGLFILDTEGTTLNPIYYFKPCIIVNGALYICDNSSNDENKGSIQFNKAIGSPTITYYRVAELAPGEKNYTDLAPIEVTRKSVEETLSPVMREIAENPETLEGQDSNDRADDGLTRESVTDISSAFKWTDCLYQKIHNMLAGSGTTRNGKTIVGPKAFALIDEFKEYMSHLQSDIEKSLWDDAVKDCIKVLKFEKLLIIDGHIMNDYPELVGMFHDAVHSLESHIRSEHADAVQTPPVETVLPPSPQRPQLPSGNIELTSDILQRIKKSYGIFVGQSLFSNSIISKILKLERTPDGVKITFLKLVKNGESEIEEVLEQDFYLKEHGGIGIKEPGVISMVPMAASQLFGFEIIDPELKLKLKEILQAQGYNTDTEVPTLEELKEKHDLYVGNFIAYDFPSARSEGRRLFKGVISNISIIEDGKIRIEIRGKDSLNEAGDITTDVYIIKQEEGELKEREIMGNRAIYTPWAAYTGTSAHINDPELIAIQHAILQSSPQAAPSTDFTVGEKVKISRFGIGVIQAVDGKKLTILFDGDSTPKIVHSNVVRVDKVETSVSDDMDNLRRNQNMCN